MGQLKDYIYSWIHKKHYQRRVCQCIHAKHRSELYHSEHSGASIPRRPTLPARLPSSGLQSMGIPATSAALACSQLQPGARWDAKEC